MTPVVIKPPSWLTTGIRVEKINNLNLFKFTEELGDRMKELLEKKRLIYSPQNKTHVRVELRGVVECDRFLRWSGKVRSRS